ncbi:hypothetical protein LCGC14_2954420 [marine sediment metagenome]|uniref:Uncharacterized protein n=1 Tax=marine sediment metagenome TaxID=412755 RepID=A0A0F8Y1I0_9ZZZZ
MANVYLARLEQWRAQLPEYCRSWTKKTDDRARVAIFETAFEIYPIHRQQTMELTIVAYMDATADVPLWALDAAMRFLMASPRGSFRPPPGEIREVAAIAIENARRYATEREDTIKPIDRSRDLTSSAIDFALRKGREMVGQPELDPARGFLTERFARTVVALDSRGGLSEIDGIIRGLFVGGAQAVLFEESD